MVGFFCSSVIVTFVIKRENKIFFLLFWLLSPLLEAGKIANLRDAENLSLPPLHWY